MSLSHTTFLKQGDCPTGSELRFWGMLAYHPYRRRCVIERPSAQLFKAKLSELSEWRITQLKRYAGHA